MCLRCLLLIVAVLLMSKSEGDDAVPEESWATALKNIPIVSAESLTQKQWSEFVPLTRDQLAELLERYSRPQSTISRTNYSARLSGTELVDGKISIDLPRQAGTRFIALGHTNFDQLKLTADGVDVPLATHSEFGWIPLIAPDASFLTGDWSATGILRGRSVVFDLKLPPADISVLKITTDNLTQVRSPNAVVLSEIVSASETTWELLPANPAKLTIECQRSSVDKDEPAFVSVNGQMNLLPDGAEAAWSIAMPKSLAGTKARFRIQGEVDLQGVRLGESDVVWQVVGKQDDVYLEVELPQSIAAPLSVFGTFTLSSQQQYQFPFLFPDVYWSAQNVKRPIRQRTASLKASVDSRVVVTRLKLDGLFKKDVSFAGNQNLVMEFEQFASQASAVVSVEKALPLVQDAVLVKVESLAANVDAFAYVHATARSGNVDTLAWDVPRSWRVTDVRELSADSPPLLYRLTDLSENITKLDVTLRNPLTLNSSNQTLVIRMQSVGNLPTSQQRPPELLTSDYQRTTDQLALSESLVSRLVSDWATTDAASDKSLQDVSWLPAGTIAGSQVYSRSELKPANSLSSSTSEIDATVNYSALVNASDVVETATIRLRSGARLPLRIPMTISADVIPELTADNSSVSFTRMRTGEGNQWVIELRSDPAELTEVEFTLTARRSLQPRLEGMAIELHNCRQTGRVIPPESDSGISLAMQTETQSSIVDAEVDYPDQPFTLELVQTIRAVAPLVISGRGFVVMSGREGRYECDAVCRCLVTAAGNSYLEFNASTLDCEVWIDGQKKYPEPFGEAWRVPLPEKQSPIPVDIVLSGGLPTTEALPHPIVSFLDSNVELSWYLLAERDQSIVAPKISGLLTVPAMRVGELISPLRSSRNEARPVLDFVSRWMLRAAHQQQCVVVPLSVAPQDLQITVNENSFWAVQAFLWGTATILFWKWLTHCPLWRCGVAILLLLALRGYLVETVPVLEGCCWGTLVFGLIRFTQQLLQKLLPDRRIINGELSKVTVAGLLFTLVSPLAFGQLSPSLPKIVSQGSQSPVVYVQRSMLESLQQLSTESTGEVAVLETQLELSIESSNSASAKIRTTVAALPNVSQRLLLPLQEVTLVECRLNGEKVFPKRTQTGKTFVAIPVAAVLPLMPLLPQTREDVPGPKTLGEWSLNTIEYEVRIAARSVEDEFRLEVPFPLSPATNTILKDPSGTISKPRLKTQLRELKGIGDRQYAFRPLSNIANVELVAELTDKVEAVPAARNAIVSCAMDILPDKLTMTTEYRVPRRDTAQNTLWLGATAESIVSVKSTAGNSLPWMAVDGGIEVTFPSGQAIDAEELIAIVRQESDSDLGMTRNIVFAKLRLIDQQPAEQATVVVRTTDQFFVDEVLGDGTPLRSIAVPITDPDLPRTIERRVVVPINVESLSVTISERISTQLVEEVSQEAIIQDTSIDWSCVFRSEISGQPAFRQVVMLPESVRVDRVTAKLLGTDRLQSWSRTKDSVVVFLREATRGTLEIQLNGTVPRIPGQPTSLPFAGFPASVQVLQSSLQLRSESSRGAFMASFGGARPNEAFDIEQPLSGAGVRLSVIDDSRPMIIKALQPQSASISLAVLVYDDAGQTRTATVMQVKPQDATAPMKFRTRSNEIQSQKPVVFRDGDIVEVTEINGVVIVPPATTQSNDSFIVIVLPNGIPISRSDSLLIQIPEFDALTQVKSTMCFELAGSDRNGPSASRLPSWVSEAVRDFDLPSLQNRRTRTAEFDPATRRVRVRIPQTNQAQPETSTAPGVFYVDCEHAIRPESNGVTGSSGFLVFASQSRSNFDVQIPEEVMVAHVRVNGDVVPLMQDNKTLFVTLPSRVSHIVVSWIAEAETKVGVVKQEIQLPHSNFIQGLTRAAVMPAVDRSRWWRTTATLESTADFREARISSILTGLQMLELDSTDESDAEFTMESSLPENLLNQIWAQSERATESVDFEFSKNERLENMHMSLTSRSLILKDFRLPSFGVIASVLLAIGMIVTPLFRSGATKARAIDSEGSTVVRDPKVVLADQLPTVVGVSSPEESTAM